MVSGGFLSAFLALFLAGFGTSYSQTISEPEEVAAVQIEAQAASDTAEDEAVRDLSEEDYARVLSGAFIHPASAPGTGLLIVEYVDFSCPFCRRQHSERVVEALRDELAATVPVRYVRKHLQIFEDGEAPKEAAMLALCSGKLGGDAAYYRASDALFAVFAQLDVGHGSSAGSFPLQTVLPQFAKNADTSVDAMKACLSDASTDARLTSEKNEMRIFGDGVPAVAIIDEATRKYVVVAGAYPLERFRSGAARLIGEDTATQ